MITIIHKLCHRDIMYADFFCTYFLIQDLAYSYQIDHFIIEPIFAGKFTRFPVLIRVS